MPFFRHPVVALEEVRLRALSPASLDPEMKVRVDNPNPLGITLRELPDIMELVAGSLAGEKKTG